MQRLKYLGLIPVLALAGAMSGCDPQPVGGSSAGGGGGGGGGTTRLVGSLVKGITANAVITVYAPNGSGGFTQLASTMSAADGGYALDLPAGFEGVVKIVATPSSPPAAPTLMRCDAPTCGNFAGTDPNDDGDGIIEFGEFSPVGADFELRAVAAIDGTGIRLVNLTPLSTVAADWAEQFPQGLDADAATAANTQVAVTFGFAASDLETPLGDMASDSWLMLADEKQIKLSLLMATFSSLSQHYGYNPQVVIDLVSQEFSENYGHLYEIGLDPAEPSVAHILTTAVTLAGVLEIPPAVQGDMTLVQQSMQDALGDLQSGQFVLPEETTVGSMLDRLGPLGDDIQTLLAATGLDDPDLFAEQQVPYFNWLVAEDNLDIFPMAFETVIYAAVGSLLVDGYAAMGPAAPDSVPMSSTSGMSVTLHPKTKTMSIAGTAHGQTVDFTLSLTGLLTALNAESPGYNVFDYGIEGTLLNGTSQGAIDGMIHVDLKDTNSAALPMLAFWAASAIGADGLAFTLNDEVKTAMIDLVRNAQGAVTLEGSASLTRLADTTQVLGGNVKLDGDFNLGAANGQHLGSLKINHLDLQLPNGVSLFTHDNRPALTVDVKNDATVDVDLRADLETSEIHAGEAVIVGQGSLTNVRGFVHYVQDVIVDEINAESPSLTNLFDQVFAYDFSQMDLHAEGEVDFPSLPSVAGARGQKYRATIDNLTATIFQPYSNEVAVVVTLDIDRQYARLALANGEQWDLRPMMTPTPRLMLLGPQGQFMEVSQEDFYAFLDSLPFNLLPDLADEEDECGSELLPLCG